MSQGFEQVRGYVFDGLHSSPGMILYSIQGETRVFSLTSESGGNLGLRMMHTNSSKV